MADDTIASYAALTQTQGWSRGAHAAVAFDATDAISIGDARYTHGELLGSGGMGKVILARDARIGREVAVKELHQRELSDEDRERFLREARVQGQLEHPSIVPVYDIDQRPDGTTFFTMRRVLGRTLHAIVEDLRAGTGKHTQRELLTAFSTVCLAIDYAHTRGVIHRDLKPANIMLGDFGEVYVLDWGLALLVGGEGARDSLDEPATRLSMTGAMLGTPLYMAPEQMGDPDVTPAADVFSLGAILFELLTLRRLRDAASIYSPVDAHDRDIAPELEAICVRATQLDPKDRYASARQLQESVNQFLEGDRDLQMRKDLAATHAASARAALARADEPDADYERERSIASNELLKTVGLDPGNASYVKTLAELLQSRPKVLPVSVKKRISDGEQDLVRTAARLSVLAMSLWLLCVPIVLGIGVRDVGMLVAVLVPTVITIGVSFHATRRKVIPLWQETAMVVGSLAGMIAVSRLYGPLVLTPTLIATFTIVLQSHPMKKQRTIAIVLGSVAMVLPIVLELAGVLPKSYLFEAGRMSILPQMIDLPEVATSLFLGISAIALVIVPGLFIRAMRVSLSEAEAQLMMQAWHLEQLTK